MPKWTVEFEVDETWVADGFNLTKAVAQNMIDHCLPFATPCEISVKIVESPDPKEIKELQGLDNNISTLKE